MSFNALLIFLNLIVVAIACSIVISLKLHDRIYRRRASLRHDQAYRPTQSIFVPCKGVNDEFTENSHAFLRLVDGRTRLFFIVESENDPAFPILESLAQDRARVVAAGESGSCGQKNHNVLKGILASGEHDEVYLFLDSNTRLTRQQVHALVTPLSDPQISVSTGFRWNILRRGTLGERLHAFMIALQWSMLNCSFIPAIWGGAMALRRETFETMAVREHWMQTSVDDMSLLELIHRQRRSVIFVPACVTETRNTILGVKGAIEWFTRQVLYTKFHLRYSWLAIVAVFAYSALNIVAFPFLIAHSLLTPGQESIELTRTVGAFVGCVTLFCTLIKRRSADNNGTLAWLALSPVYLLLSSYAILRTLFMRRLAWKGIVYHLDFHGRVKKIVRE